MRVPRGEAAQRSASAGTVAAPAPMAVKRSRSSAPLTRGAALVRGHGPEERIGRRSRRRGRTAVEQRDDLRRAQVQAQHAAPGRHRARSTR